MRLRMGFRQWQSIRQRRAASGIETSERWEWWGGQARRCLCRAIHSLLENINGVKLKEEMHSPSPSCPSACLHWAGTCRGVDGIPRLTAASCESPHHPPLAATHPPSIHRSADATLMHRGRRAHPFTAGVSITEGFFSSAVISSGWARPAVDVMVFPVGPSVRMTQTVNRVVAHTPWHTLCWHHRHIRWWLKWFLT